MKQFVTCRIDDRPYGIDIGFIREINKNFLLTPVERCPDYISGLVNIRGQIVTVLDVGVRMGLPVRKNSGQLYNIVLKGPAELVASGILGDVSLELAEDDKVGFLVDSVGDVVEIDERQIEAVPANVAESQAAFLSGVVRDGAELFAILDVPKVLAGK